MSEATGETSDPDAGYQGDVQPFVALPRGLANAGHEAVLAAPHRFEGFVRDQGVPSAGIDDCWSVAAEGPGAGADILVDNGQVVVGQHVTEKLGIPAVLALPIPMYVPTREFPWAGMAIPRWWPSALNRATFLGVKGPAMMFGRTVDRWRDGGPAATPWPA
jgi:sterol 3beta-glucosyltransferase